MSPEYQKSGYLLEDFRIFHNADTSRRDIPFHYHDFHKLLLFLSGNAGYIIEGRQYILSPGDVVLVRAGQIHRPVVHDDSLYERIIIYADPAFFSGNDLQELNLFPDTSAASADLSPLIRLSGHSRKELDTLIPQLKAAARDRDLAASLLRRIKFWELLILLGRAVQNTDLPPAPEISANPIVLSALKYIHEHLSDENLDIDHIAGAAAAGRSYLMHLFKSQMGYTIGQYITEKRLYTAGTLIRGGVPVTQACFQSGFRNYAAFYYAYQKKYGSAPSGGQIRPPRIDGE